MLNSRSNRIKIKVKLIKMGCGKKNHHDNKGDFKEPRMNTV